MKRRRLRQIGSSQQENRLLIKDQGHDVNGEVDLAPQNDDIKDASPGQETQLITNSEAAISSKTPDRFNIQAAS